MVFTESISTTQDNLSSFYYLIPVKLWYYAHNTYTVPMESNWFDNFKQIQVDTKDNKSKMNIYQRSMLQVETSLEPIFPKSKIHILTLPPKPLNMNLL